MAVTAVTAEEANSYGFADNQHSIALVGNIGSSYWNVFSQSQEFGDGGPDPLDRWSQRIASEIVTQFPLTPIYPFGTTGSITWDGRRASWNTLFRAGTLTADSPGFSPVLPLTSNRGKLLDEMSSRIR